MTIAFNGVTNGPVGTGKTVAVATTSDPSTRPSAPFDVVGGAALSAVSVTVGSLAPSTRTRYVVRATASATGALAQDANSRIVVAFPAGTSFTGWGGGTVHAGADVGNCGSPVGTTVECSLFSGRTVAAGAQLRLTFLDVTNPASAGPHRLTAATTSDTPATTSSDYTTDGGTQAPETVLESGPAGTTDDATPTFTFSSSEPGGFECRVDEGAFAPCTSPHTTGELADGAHVFAVRAVDLTGVPDPTPATRAFTVARPVQATPTPTPGATPAPTATATPAPTPEFREEVVVAPAGGTVQVCAKPGAGCTPLAAGKAIPMGSTIDARKGVVELTSLSAPGAPPQTARFSEGMFVVRQVGAITELTLNEPLDCRSKQARAAAQKRKPKSRRLWGDGKGKFRTKGTYAAATVRGTRWLVQDTCTTTLVRVTQGSVSVRDSVKRKTLTLRSGKRYTTRARR